MKITQSAAKKPKLQEPTVLVQEDLATSPRPSSRYFWNHNTKEVVITLTGEKTSTGTYEYTTTLTVSDLLSCLRVLLTALKPTPQPQANKTKPVRP